MRNAQDGMDWTMYFGDELVDVISDAELGTILLEARSGGFDVHVDLVRETVVVA